MNEYDLVVIGGGPGGYKCAIRAAQLGLSVACIDNNDNLGGTCLRVGCIPSKALLHSSYEYYNCLHNLSKIGIKSDSISFDLSKIMSHKDENIKYLANGINFLFDSNRVKRLIGFAQIHSFSEEKVNINVKMKSGVKNITANNVVIATGSNVLSLPNVQIDEKNIISSSAALSLTEVPKKMAIIGAGAIGLEMSSIWSRLGAKVTVIEFFDSIAYSMDEDIRKTLLNSLKKQGIDFTLSSKVLSADIIDNENINVKIQSLVDQSEHSIQVNKLLVSVGRGAFIDKLFKNNEISLNDKGYIKVDGNYRTNIKNIFAIGDVIGGQMLAHKAEEEGVAVAEIIVGQSSHVDYQIIPSVIYTHPCVASIGKTESQLKKLGYNYKLGKSNFSANGRARITNDFEGFVKVISCKKTDTILGIHIIGSHADTMINEASVAMAYGASSEDLYRICHSHPDVNESLKDASGVAYFK